MNKLSGDKAHELFMSNEAFPLHLFLEEYQRQAFRVPNNNWSPGYVLAVINAYRDMCSICKDGRYDGKIRGTYQS